MDESAQNPPSALAPEIAIELISFYAYGYRGRAMYAVRAPFAMPQTGEGLVGRVARIEGKLYRILAILRQIAGPITAGEMIGVEVSRPGQALESLSDAP